MAETGPGVRERICQDELFFDSAVVSHGFAAFLRDYDVIIEVIADRRDGSGRAYVEGRYRYRFTHCVEAIAVTTVDPTSWAYAWEDLFTDYAAWEQAGAPAGYVWGVCWAEAYPGMSYTDGSQRAARWSSLLGHEMHEYCIQTNALTLDLVFYGLRVEKIAVGDPTTTQLTPLPAPTSDAPKLPQTPGLTELSGER